MLGSAARAGPVERHQPWLRPLQPGHEAAQHGGSQHEAVPVALLPQPRQAVLLVVVEELDVSARQLVGAGPPHVHHDEGRHDVTLGAYGYAQQLGDAVT